MRILSITCIYLLTLVSCDPFGNKIEKESNEDAAIHYTAATITPVQSPPDTLEMVTWNIKFGGGRIDFFFDCYGDRVLMTKEEVIANLDALIVKINQMNPDVLFLQEIDIDSKRSAYVDQLQYILDHTALNYAVYGSQWQSDFVPSDGIGRMNSGNAIVSKYPLSNAERIPLSLIDDQSAITRYFYLRRNLLKADVQIGNKSIVVLGTHTEAYSTDDTKLKQLKEIKDQLDKLNSSGKRFVIGGDFNTIPPKSLVYEKFDDDKCEVGSDFESQSFKDELTVMQPFYNAYQSAIPLGMYEADNAPYFSFTSDKNGFWNRCLDYVFTNGEFVYKSGLVHQDAARGGMNTMPLSDHAPLSVKYILK